MSQLFAQLTTPHWLLLGVALVGLFGAMWFKPIWQRNSLSIKGNNYGDISQNNTMHSPTGKGAGADGDGGKWLSFLADVLQVIGFVITVMQLVGLAKS